MSSSTNYLTNSNCNALLEIISTIRLIVESNILSVENKLGLSEEKIRNIKTMCELDGLVFDWNYVGYNKHVDTSYSSFCNDKLKNLLDYLVKFEKQVNALIDILKK